MARRNPLLPQKPKQVKTIDLPKSAGILDDHAIRKTLAAKEIYADSVDGVDVSAHTHGGAGQGGTVDHVNLSNKGTNTHANIDTHIGDSTRHFTGTPTVADPVNQEDVVKDKVLATGAATLADGSVQVTTIGVLPTSAEEGIIVLTEISSSTTGDTYSYDLDDENNFTIYSDNAASTATVAYLITGFTP